MTIEEAISYLSPIADSASDKMHYGEALEVAISALRDQAERENSQPQPLTLEELAQAEKEGRMVVLQNVKYTDSDGEKALRHAMYMCGVQNNPVTRYTADAIAEKLTRESAEAALKDLEAEYESNV